MFLSLLTTFYVIIEGWVFGENRTYVFRGDWASVWFQKLRQNFWREGFMFMSKIIEKYFFMKFRLISRVVLNIFCRKINFLINFQIDLVTPPTLGVWVPQDYPLATPLSDLLPNHLCTEIVHLNWQNRLHIDRPFYILLWGRS